MIKREPRMLHVAVDELPIEVVLTGPSGRVERFKLVAAGRKFGASLQKSEPDRKSSAGK